MLKKVAAFAVLTSFGALLLAFNNASAAITRAESYITIDSATSDDYTLDFNAVTYNNVSSNTLYTEMGLYKGSKFIGLWDGTVRADGSYTEDHGSKTTWKVLTDHYEYKGSTSTVADFDQTDDTVTYKPADWTFAAKEKLEETVESKEAKKAEVEFENAVLQTTNVIALDTGIDLSEYTKIDKKQVFELDADLFQEVNELTSMRTLQPGDSMPQIYLHGSGESLYVLKQSSDGVSSATEFVLDNGKWKRE
ncbi:hypothetical protein [Brevibacillus centrosporus]|uniref:hypothetical protein n=1 Tax=Brevibacillus centrosporus TaxID=54910 RepID=UPI0039884BA8